MNEIDQILLMGLTFKGGKQSTNKEKQYSRLGYKDNLGRARG